MASKSQMRQVRFRWSKLVTQITKATTNGLASGFRVGVLVARRTREKRTPRSLRSGRTATWRVLQPSKPKRTTFFGDGKRRRDVLSLWVMFFFTGKCLWLKPVACAFRVEDWPIPGIPAYLRKGWPQRWCPYMPQQDFGTSWLCFTHDIIAA